MRARLGIDAAIGEPQPLDGTAGDQMLFNDLSCVFGAHATVPDRLRIDHNGGAVLALIETEGFVDADAVGNSRSFSQLLQLGVQFAFAIRGAGRAGCSGGTNVVANEDVVFKRRQARESSCFQTKRRSRRKKLSTNMPASPPASARMCAWL